MAPHDLRIGQSPRGVTFGHAGLHTQAHVGRLLTMTVAVTIGVIKRWMSA